MSSNGAGPAHERTYTRCYCLRIGWRIGSPMLVQFGPFPGTPLKCKEQKLKVIRNGKMGSPMGGARAAAGRKTQADGMEVCNLILIPR